MRYKLEIYFRRLKRKYFPTKFQKKYINNRNIIKISDEDVFYDWDMQVIFAIKAILKNYLDYHEDGYGYDSEYENKTLQSVKRLYKELEYYTRSYNSMVYDYKYIQLTLKKVMDILPKLWD